MYAARGSLYQPHDPAEVEALESFFRTRLLQADIECFLASASSSLHAFLLSTHSKLSHNQADGKQTIAIANQLVVDCDKEEHLLPGRGHVSGLNVSGLNAT